LLISENLSEDSNSEGSEAERESSQKKATVVEDYVIEKTNVTKVVEMTMHTEKDTKKTSSTFSLINVRLLDSRLFNTRQRIWRGESSKNNDHLLFNSGREQCGQTRLVSLNLSNSISDTNILNCTIRLRGSKNGIEELRLWGIGKEIGVICQESEDSIIQKFSKMEERDSQLLRAMFDEGDSIPK